METIERVCKECGGKFTAEARDARRGRALYCSVRCRRPAAARKRQVRRKATIGVWFWDKVDRSGGAGTCWPWLGSGLPAGYGRYIIDGHHIMAHRTAYSLVHGEITDASFVCHHCDNPPCCNPKHLFLGDPAANARDCQQKGRYPSGQKHHAARLTESEVRTIRERLADGETASSIGRDYPVHFTTICRIRSGKTWKPLKAVEAKDG